MRAGACRLALSTTAAQALLHVRARALRKAPPAERAADIIARLAEPQRDELVVQQLKRLEPGTYARLSRDGAAHMGREEVRAAAGAADVYVPGGAGGRKQSWVWRHAYLLRSCPGQSFCRRCCPLTPEGVPTERATWLAGGVIGYPKSRITTNLANHLRTHGQALSSRLHFRSRGQCSRALACALLVPRDWRARQIDRGSSPKPRAALRT